MTKYEEALKVIMQYNPSKDYVDACCVLKEAISKAEKYDEAMKCNESFENEGVTGNGKIPYFLNILNTIESINNENKMLRRDAIVYRQDIDNAYKTFDSFIAENERLKAEINTLVEGIKEWLLIFYNQKKNRRGEFNLTFDEYVRGMIAEYNDNLQEEDVDFEYVSKIKAMLEIVEGKK